MAGTVDSMKLPDGLSMEAVQKQAGHLWEFLDEMATRDPEEYTKFLQKQMQAANAAPRKTRVEETPTAGFCVRLRQRSQVPLYVNVCAHSRVEPPSKTPDGSVPLAVGVPRSGASVDGAGLVVDVVVSVEVTQRAARDALYREEIAALAAQCVREVLTRVRLLPDALVPGYRVLPGVTYAGTPQPFTDANQTRETAPAEPASEVDDLSAIERLVSSMGLAGGGKVPPQANADVKGRGASGRVGKMPAASDALPMQRPGHARDDEAAGVGRGGVVPSPPLVQEISSQDAVEEAPDHELEQVASGSW